MIRFDGYVLPVWDEATSRYLDPVTGEVLPTWDQALDGIGPADVPLHVARFGAKFDAQGVLAGSKDANRCIRGVRQRAPVRRGAGGAVFQPARPAELEASEGVRGRLTGAWW